VKPKYVPDSGDLAWLTFDPPAGREQDRQHQQLRYRKRFVRQQQLPRSR
jgi:hypothetical protein